MPEALEKERALFVEGSPRLWRSGDVLFQEVPGVAQRHLCGALGFLGTRLSGLPVQRSDELFMGLEQTIGAALIEIFQALGNATVNKRLGRAPWE